ncbi:PLDc N-terminal domain-containing protein [Aneurinibacillus migulanus]|uniref:PLDc N-terminal domain-containing protein n=1 Tax=Aneurinibacillus migulanus TaxID=47500 RepID=UPI0009BBB659
MCICPKKGKRRIHSLLVLSVSFILEERTPYNTLLWLSLLFFMSIFGYILYLYSG